MCGLVHHLLDPHLAALASRAVGGQGLRELPHHAVLPTAAILRLAGVGVNGRLTT